LACTFLTNSPKKDSLFQSTWILGSLPGTYDKVLDGTHKQSVVGIIDIVFDLPTELGSKEWIEKHLASKGFARPIIDWLSTNIVPVEEADGTVKTPPVFKCSFDFTTVKNLFDDFCDTEMWTFLENYTGTATLQISFCKLLSWLIKLITNNCARLFQGIGFRDNTDNEKRGRSSHGRISHNHFTK